VAIQGDGRIVAAGWCCIDNSRDFALIRYNTDGSLDTTFDGDGRVRTDFGGNDTGQGVAIQGDGKIVAAGFAGFGAVALARYNADGSLDPTFGGDGMVTREPGGANAVAIQRGGKIVTAGSGADFVVDRYNIDGSIDTTFGGDGRVSTDFAGSSDHSNAVAIQADGKIVAAGTAFVGTNDFALARYLFCTRTARASGPFCR